MSRLVVIGHNSKIWQTLRKDSAFADSASISHNDVAAFNFEPTDRVWILSYSRNDRQNTELFENIAADFRGSCCYVSSATANVATLTTCYEYPTAKHRAESEAKRILKAKIVRIGLIFERSEELPSGTNAATSFQQLKNAMSAEELPSEHLTLLLSMLDRPFGSKTEHWAYNFYGKAVHALRSRPCLLRPIDLVFRLVGWKWYGYLFLSNTLLLTSSRRLEGATVSDT